MRLEESKDWAAWDQFLAGQELAPILQTAAWHQSDQRRLLIWRQNDLIKGGVLLLSRQTRGFRYWTAQQGPVWSADLSLAARRDCWLEAVKVLSTWPAWAFARLSPRLSASDWQRISVGSPVKASVNLEPDETLVVDLRLSEAELLAGMHHKTRYNIKLAEKKGVSVRLAKESDWPVVLTLLQDTARRDHFRLHPSQYYQILFAKPQVKIYVAAVGGKILAVGVFTVFGDTSTYLHGASANHDRALMAPYLLHWRVMRAAKTQGLNYYDFFGISQQRWPGVTRFKLGFGGQRQAVCGTFDLVNRKGYYRLYKFLRYWRRCMASDHYVG